MYLRILIDWTLSTGGLRREDKLLNKSATERQQFELEKEDFLRNNVRYDEDGGVLTLFLYIMLAVSMI